MMFSSLRALPCAALLLAVQFTAVTALPMPLSPNPEFQARDDLNNLDKRACSADNLLRLLRTPSNLPEAYPFCRTLLGLSAITTYTTVFPVVYVLLIEMTILYCWTMC